MVGASRKTAWHAGHYGVAFRMTAPEEYVPLMMDQGHPHEGEHGSLLSPSWGDEAPEADGTVPLGTLEATIIGYR